MAENVPPVIRVALIEDRRELRDAIGALLGGTPGYVLTGAYRSVEDALSPLGAELPEVVLTDIGLPGVSGIEGIRILKEKYPSLLFVVLTIYEDDERIFDALCAGATGYLLKKTP